MKHHPKDRFERRSIEAKALELRQFKQQRINGKKHKYQTEIEKKETEDELHDYRNYDLYKQSNESRI